jgi:hypothetical protein
MSDPAAPPTNDQSVDRRFARITLSNDVRLYSSSQVWETQILDLSLQGAQVTRPEGFSGRKDQNFRLEIRLQGSAVISMGVELARIEEDRLGFRAGRMDFDSFTHLKRLIELNLGDPEGLSAELSRLTR